MRGHFLWEFESLPRHTNNNQSKRQFHTKPLRWPQFSRFFHQLSPYKGWNSLMQRRWMRLSLAWSDSFNRLAIWFNMSVFCESPFCTITGNHDTYSPKSFRGSLEKRLVGYERWSREEVRYRQNDRRTCLDHRAMFFKTSKMHCMSGQDKICTV